MGWYYGIALVNGRTVETAHPRFCESLDDARSKFSGLFAHGPWDTEHEAMEQSAQHEQELRAS